MIKTFFKHGFIYSFSSFLSKSLSLILLPIYVRVLSSADYGFLDIAVIIGSLVNFIITLEIGQGIARFYGSLDSIQDRIKMASTAFWFTICGYAIFIFIAFYLKNSILSIIKIDNVTDLIFLLVICYYAVSGIFLFLQNQFRWQLQAKLNVFINILNLLVTTFSTVVLLLVFKMGIAGMFLGMIIGNMISSISAVYLLKEIQFVFDIKILKSLLSFSGPLVFSSIAFIVATGIDRFVIKAIMTLEDVGMYGIAYRLSSPISLVMSGFQTALTPLIYKGFKDEQTKNDISTIFRYFCVLSMGMFLGLSIFAPEMLIVLTTEKYFGVYKVIPYLILSVLLSQQYVFFSGLGIANKTKIIAVIRIMEAGLNVIFNFLLIPNFGITGAAVATFLSILVATIIYIYQSQKYYKLNIPWIRVFIAFSVCITIVLLIQNYFIIYSFFISILVKLLLFLAVFFLITFVLARQELKLILNRIKQLM